MKKVNVLFYDDEQKQKVLHKWEHILCDKCEICNGEKYVNNQPCKCKLKAVKYTKLETNNIPILGLKTHKEHIQKIDFDFKAYFDSIHNEMYNIPNLYLCDLSNALNIEVIGYMAKNLINTTHNISGESITVYYDIFENLIQLALRSNIEKDARNKLNMIIHTPYILFLDGIGTETGLQSSTQHNVKLLNLILKERFNRCKSTVISSMLTLPQIEQMYGQETVRFLQCYKVIKGVS